MANGKPGAPKGSRNRQKGDMIAKLMREYGQIKKNNRPPSAELVPLDEIVFNTIDAAVEGDAAARKEVFERIGGKVPQAISGPDDGPIEIEHSGSAKDAVAELLALNAGQKPATGD